MKKILGNPILVFVSLMVFPPLGIFLMFTFTDWTNAVKLALASVFGVIFIIAVVMTMNESAAEEAKNTLGYIRMTM